MNETGNFDRFTIPTLMKKLPDLLREAEKVDREKLRHLVIEQCMMIDQPETYEKDRKAFENTSRWFSDPCEVCGFTEEQKQFLKNHNASISTEWFLTYKVVIRSDDPKWKYGRYYGTGINAVCTPRPKNLPIEQVHMEINWPETIAKMQRWIKHAMKTNDLENPNRFEDDLREKPLEERELCGD